LFLKVEVEYEGKDTPEKLAEQILRVIQRIYAVRKVELSHVVDGK
jgi:hypothetical protein